MIDSSTIYCLVTGKPIAAINDDEFGFILESLVGRVPVEQQFDHLERLCLTSMRPSIAWHSVTPDSMNHMLEIAPRQVLAYLMNRLYAPIELDRFGKPLNHSAWLSARRQRIQIWESIEQADLSAERLDQLLYALLDIDSRFNLTKVVKPSTVVTLWESWSDTSCESFLKAVWAWRETLVAAQEKAQRQAKWQAEFWSEGNRMTRNALASTFAKVKPLTPAQKERKAANLAKTHKLAEDLDFLNQLERELTGNGSASEAVAVVSPKPVFKFTKFGKQ